MELDEYAYMDNMKLPWIIDTMLLQNAKYVGIAMNVSLTCLNG